MATYKDIIDNLFDYSKKHGNVVADLIEKMLSSQYESLVEKIIEAIPDKEDNFNEYFEKESDIEALYDLKNTDPDKFYRIILNETLLLNIFLKSINIEGNVVISLDDFYKSYIINIKFN